jgi:HSP20 family protein
MWLVKTNPRSESYDLPVVFDRWFQDFWQGDAPSLRALEEDSVTWAPRVDVTESEDAYKIVADLPGLKKEEINISLNDNVLTLKGERKHEEEKKEKNSYYKERSYGSFSRSFRMPEKVKGEEINANYKDGVLEITVPKAEEVKPKTIEIR